MSEQPKTSPESKEEDITKLSKDEYLEGLRTMKRLFSFSDLSFVPEEWQPDIALTLLQLNLPKPALHAYSQIIPILFKNLDKRVAMQMIQYMGAAKCVAENLPAFKGLDGDVAHELSMKHYEDQVLKNLQLFNKSDQIRIIYLSVGHALCKEAEAVSKYIRQYSQIHPSIAYNLIEKGYGLDVMKNLDRFEGVADEKMAQAMIKAGLDEYVVKYLNIFSGLDEEVAIYLIKQGFGLEVMNNLDYFDGIDQDKIAEAMIAAGQGKFVKLNLDIFDDLSEEMKEKVGNL